MVPNKKYHGKKPNLDRLEIVYIDDASTKMMEYEQGNIDMCDVSYTHLDVYKRQIVDYMMKKEKLKV